MLKHFFTPDRAQMFLSSVVWPSVGLRDRSSVGRIDRPRGCGITNSTANVIPSMPCHHSGYKVVYSGISCSPQQKPNRPFTHLSRKNDFFLLLLPLFVALATETAPLVVMMLVAHLSHVICQHTRTILNDFA